MRIFDPKPRMWSTGYNKRVQFWSVSQGQYIYVRGVACSVIERQSLKSAADCRLQMIEYAASPASTTVV